MLTVIVDWNLLLYTRIHAVNTEFGMFFYSILTIFGRFYTTIANQLNVCLLF